MPPETPDAPVPTIGISACLLGERVRYDGAHKRASALLSTLDQLVRWIPVCPEVEAGFGVPREPIQLEGDAGNPRVTGLESGEDKTAALRTAAQRLVKLLTDHGVHGVVLKSRSPSCGMRDVPITGPSGEVPGRGVFAELVMRERPDWVVADETELATTSDVHAFLDRVRTAAGYCS